MPTTIVFSSEKGGVGKTTSAVNTAMAFAIGGYKTLLVDMDPQGSVRFSFGIKGAVTKGTRQLVTEPGTPLQELLIRADGGQELDFIFANFDSLADEREALRVVTDPTVLRTRLQKEARHYDFIILDSQASTSMLALNAIAAADLVILPLQCESLAVKSLKRYLSAFKEMQQKYNPDLRIAGILMTMYDRNMEVHRRICRQMYETLYDSVFSTIIPSSREVPEASALGQSVITYRVNSIGATAYIRLAKEILDKFNLRPPMATP